MAANAMSKVLSSVLPAQLTKRRLSEESGSGSGDSHSLLDRLTHKKLKRDEAQDDRLSAIEEHGVIGNMRTCALVSVSAEIDWSVGQRQARSTAPAVCSTLMARCTAAQVLLSQL